MIPPLLYNLLVTYRQAGVVFGVVDDDLIRITREGRQIGTITSDVRGRTEVSLHFPFDIEILTRYFEQIMQRDNHDIDIAP